MQGAIYGEAKERHRSKLKGSFVDILKQLEEALGDKAFFGGDTFGFVDIIAIPLTSWFYAIEKLGNFKV